MGPWLPCRCAAHCATSPSGQDRSAQTGVARRQVLHHRCARAQPRPSARRDHAATVSNRGGFTSAGSACITPQPSPERGTPPMRHVVPIGATAGTAATRSRPAVRGRRARHARTWTAPGRARLLLPPQSAVGHPARTPACGGRASVCSGCGGDSSMSAPPNALGCRPSTCMPLTVPLGDGGSECPVGARCPFILRDVLPAAPLLISVDASKFWKRVPGRSGFTL